MGSHRQRPSTAATNSNNSNSSRNVDKKCKDGVVITLDFENDKVTVSAKMGKPSCIRDLFRTVWSKNANRQVMKYNSIRSSNILMIQMLSTKKHKKNRRRYIQIKRHLV